MQVIKVLNNSLILAMDQNGQETILMGKGIGFNKSIGKEILAEEIEKVFILKDRTVSRNIVRLAADTEPVFFELTKNIIDYAIEQYHMELLEHIYLSLTDHIAFAVRRHKEGICLRNFYTPDIKRFHAEEFLVGEYALLKIKECCQVDLPIDEAGHIAFHFINAQSRHRYQDTETRITSMVEDILKIVRRTYGCSFNESSLEYTRFLTHLCLFAKRLLEKDLMPEKMADPLYSQVMETCGRENICADHITSYVQKKFSIVLTNQEKLYLMIHLYRIQSAVKVDQ
jgi:Transcriptional antiterminator